MLRVTLLLTLLLVAATSSVAYDDKFDGKLLLGKWEPDNLPPAVIATIEFKKNDKVVVVEGRQGDIEGTYKLENDTLTVTLSKLGKEKVHSFKVMQLTAKELRVMLEAGDVVLFKKAK